MEDSKSFKRFLIIWLGEFISSIGSGLTAFGLGVYVYQLTHTATSVALVTLCAFLPSILLSPVGGVLADRFDRRLLMMAGDGFSVTGLIFILVMISTGRAELWHICLGVTISSIFSSLLEPAYKATVTDLLTEEEYGKASGMVQVAGSSKYLLSPVIAGFLLSVTDIRTILFIDMGTFIVTVAAVMVARNGLKVARSSKTQQSFIEALKEGWQVIAKKKGVLMLVILMTLATFFMGFVQTLVTPMVLPLTNSKVLGTLESISAIGMLVSSLYIGGVTIKKGYSKILVRSFMACGLFVILLGITPNIFMIGIAAFLFFATLPFMNMSADVLVRKNIPNEVQGRAWGIIGIISQLGYVIAYAISGVLADYVFNPLLIEGGALAKSLGKIIGTGESRGIGLLFIISGILTVVLALVISRQREIKALEVSKIHIKAGSMQG